MLTLDDLQSTYGQLGDGRKPVISNERKLELWTRIGDPRGVASVLVDLGEQCIERHQYRRARSNLERAAVMWRSLDSPSGESTALEKIERIEIDERNFPHAISTASRRLELSEKAGGQRAEAAALSDVAQAYYYAGNYDQAISYAEQSRAIRHQMGDVSAEAAMYSLVGAPHRRDGEYLECAAKTRLAIGLLEPLRASIVSPKWREGVEGMRTYDDNLVLSLMGLDREQPGSGYAIQALEAADYARARSFLEPGAVPPSFMGSRRALLKPGDILLEYWFGTYCSYLWAVTPAAYRVYELPLRGTIESLAGRTYCLLIERSRRVPSEATVKKNARIALADTAFKKAVSELSHQLLAPAAELLNAKRLIVVADGLVQMFPFAVLPDPLSPALPIARNHEIVNVPSLVAVDYMRDKQNQLQNSGNSVAILADPVFNKDDARLTDKELRLDAKTLNHGLLAATRAARLSPRGTGIPRLPFSRVEATNIQSVAPPNSSLSLMDFNATVDALKSGLLNDYPILHVAT